MPSLHSVVECYELNQDVHFIVAFCIYDDIKLILAFLTNLQASNGSKTNYYYYSVFY